MKLANALSQRAELQTRIHQLETRLYNNAQVQEGESPAEDPQDLLQELEEDYARLEALIACINRTNCCTLVDGVPLSDLLARRDCRKGKLGILRNFLDNASELVSRRTVGEISPAARWARSGSAALWMCAPCRERWTGCPKSCGSWMRKFRRQTGPPRFWRGDRRGISPPAGGE